MKYKSTQQLVPTTCIPKHTNRRHTTRTQAGGIDVRGTLQLPSATQWSPPPPATPNGASPSMGQVAGVATAITPGTAWVLHRGLRTWDATSFSPDNRITYADAIAAPTVFLLDTATGDVLRTLGAGMLSMPHLITPTREGSVWVTDVGRHQAIELNGTDGAVLRTLGTLGEPGNGATHLCKPTHVQVDHEGNVYVADGYCNARVAVFDRGGTHLRDLTLPDGAMSVPHSIVLDECGGSLVVADRENQQLVVFAVASGNVQMVVSTAQFGFPYAVTAGPYGTTLALVWDRTADNSTVLALDTSTCVVLGGWTRMLPLYTLVGILAACFLRLSMCVVAFITNLRKFEGKIKTRA